MLVLASKKRGKNFLRNVGMSTLLLGSRRVALMLGELDVVMVEIGILENMGKWVKLGQTKRGKNRNGGDAGVQEDLSAHSCLT